MQNWMDLETLLRKRSSLSKHADQQIAARRSPAEAAKRLGFSAMSLAKILVASLVALPVLFALSLMLRPSPSDRALGFAEARVLHDRSAASTATGGQNTPPPPSPGSEAVFSEHAENLSDKLLDGLLLSGFDEATCTSRYRSFLYRKSSHHKPSSYLVAKLRNYEDLHKRCGPGTHSYNLALEQLKSGSKVGSTDCNYIVWISYSGLGNRMLALASTFLYALLTNRVLLVDPGKDMADLFCEPFPEKSWLLPLDFPLINQFNGFGQNSSHCYGNMLKNNPISASAELIPSFLYLHLVHDYGDHDKLFFCDGDQALLAKVPWLIMKTDNYFVPSLFLMTSFDEELSKMFPEKGTVFHHLGRYLFHPSNHVWGLIVRYYQVYLSKADEKIGLQVRVFDARPGPLKHVMDQILACTLKEKLLPDVDLQDSIVNPSENPKSTAVLVTSLNSGYSENLRNMYWDHPTVTGGLIGVYQPSHEGYQQSDKQMHNRKAWAEMYLLSLTDVLVTSSWSTFGYVAQGLGGLKPWILSKPENDITPDPPCRQAMSVEPCFHAPPFYDCKARRGTDTGALVPHVRHCEDMSWGLKVVDSHYFL